MSRPVPAAAVVLALCIGTASAFAAPAPYYQWRSDANGTDACAQTSPGPGWRQVAGPFVDAACRRRLRVVPL